MLKLQRYNITLVAGEQTAVFKSYVKVISWILKAGSIIRQGVAPISYDARAVTMDDIIKNDVVKFKGKFYRVVNIDNAMSSATRVFMSETSEVKEV